MQFPGNSFAEGVNVLLGAPVGMVTALVTLVQFVVLTGMAGTIGWIWAHQGTRKFLGRRAPHVETLDTVSLPLKASTTDDRILTALAMVPLALLVTLGRASHLIGLGDLSPTESLWFARWGLALLPAITILVFASRQRAPHLTLTPTSLILSRPLRPDRILPLVEVHEIAVGDREQVWLITDSERIAAGRMLVAIPESMTQAVALSAGETGRVDPALERVLGHSKQADGG